MEGEKVAKLLDDFLSKVFSRLFNRTLADRQQD